MKDKLITLVPDILLNKYIEFKLQLKRQKALKEFEGSEVSCTICKKEFSQFLEYGVSKRKNALCPNCGSLERDRLIWKFLNERTNLINSSQPLKVLHFAPEKVFYKIFSKHPTIEYYPCDLVPKRFTFANSTKITKADITKIPFENNKFDVIICNHVLEHIPNDALAMSELYRVLKHKGWAILQVPIDYSLEHTYEDFSITDPKEREKAFGQYDHVRWYGKDYPDRLSQAGFKVTEDNFISSFNKDELEKFGFISSELIYLCRK